MPDMLPEKTYSIWVFEMFSCWDSIVFHPTLRVNVRRAICVSVKGLIFVIIIVEILVTLFATNSSQILANC